MSLRTYIEWSPALLRGFFAPSRTPLARSEYGLGKMAMLRIFTQNGEKVTADHIRVSRSKKERTKDHIALKNGL
ncbi:MAG: hypothetical protein IKZ82_02555 [Clostridia bacterium]|nr:hypothetical protein [Clostridia bacterium]